MALFEKKETAAVSPEVLECERRIEELLKCKERLLVDIGSKFLENNSLEKIAGTPYEASAKEVSEIDKEREFQEKRKLAVQGLRRCEKCGNILVLDSMFCNKCGEKLNPLFVTEVQNGNICSVCGAEYKEGAMFCTACGNKLK